MKRFIAVFILSVFVFSTTVAAESVQTLDHEQYTIFTPYEYPIVPGTPEWIELETNIDKIDACSIPDEMVQQMSTEALLETYLTHPLATNIFSFDNYDSGFKVLKQYYHMGLDELVKRDDLRGVILDAYARISVCTSDMTEDMTTEAFLKTYDQEIDDMWRMSLLEVLAAEIDVNNTNQRNTSFADAFEEKYYEKIKNASLYGRFTDTYYRTIAGKNDVQVLNYDTYVYTPRGTAVLATYVTGPEYDKATQQASAAKIAQKYPNATLLRPASPKYNCHSYAWYSTASTNSYVVWDVAVYMNDGSYKKTLTAQNGARIYYAPAAGNDNHSGIVSSISPVVVTSKWGQDGLYRHDYYDCPYYNNGGPNNISFWIAN